MGKIIKKVSGETANLSSKALVQGSLLLSTVSAIMFVVNMTSAYWDLAILTGVVAIWFLGTAAMLGFTKKRMQAFVLMMLGAYAMMMYYLITGGAEGFSIVWLLIVPPAAMYCLSLYYGLLFSLILGASMMIYMWTPLFQLGYEYSRAYQVRFPIVYFSVVVLCSVTQFRVYEYRQRQSTLITSLENAGQEKNNFLANMSHEIRTPMNAIVGMCELILREDISDDVRENCFNIQSSGRSLLSIINDILDFSKIEAGKMELIKEPFNIASTINDVINMAMTRKGDKDIEIIVRVDPTIPKGLIGDEVRIRQVIVNLLTNAVKFTKKGCVIIKVTQSKHDYGINLNVSIEDTGIGISEENMEKLFNSFQQLDTKKNRTEEGTGLGLAISKKLISKMGGFMNVSSVYGEGTVFKFVIPLKVSDETPFIEIDSLENANIAVYLDMKKYSHPKIATSYRKMIQEVIDHFGVAVTVFTTFEGLKAGMDSGQYTHCFTAREEYNTNTEWFHALADKCQVVVIQERVDAAKLPPNIKKIYKPFYVLSFAAVMNNEKYTIGVDGLRNANIRFTAPNAKVLIVDDHLVNLKVAAGLMKPYNMKIITVSSGQAAIEALRTKDYDIVFMDHMMPEMDGVEATNHIRSMPGDYYQKVPIIALTANAVSGAREMFLESGFNDFLAKPIEISFLDRILRTWLPQEYQQSNSDIVKVEDDKYEEHASKEILNGPVDYKMGLGYAGEDREQYYSVLSVYVRNSKEDREAIIRHYEIENWTDYITEVHALKSSSLTMGAKELSELAKTLEFAGKDGKYDMIHQNHDKVIALYDEVVKNITAYLEENGYKEETEEIAEDDLKTITWDLFEEKVQGIIEACENFDGDEVVRVAGELCYCKVNDEILTARFEQVKQYVEDFEYEKAMQTAQNALDELRR